ncbi:MAG: M15 family metallopeptidase [Bacillota bacterium]|nr:M15 family metallopeptidase [Bacillota bacterium]
MTTAVIIIVMALVICAAFLFLMSGKRKGDVFGGPYYPDGEIEEDENESYESEPAEEENEPVEKENEAGEENVMIRDEDFVNVKEYIPDIEVELKYASEDNFTGWVIYDFDEAYLRYGTVRKLAEAQDKLKEKGFRIKIWDAFRPVSAQFKLWEVYPDDTFVANPNTGASSHSRGNTVDITLVKTGGDYVEMPTGFDDFSEQAKRTYEGVSEAAKMNSLLMERIMEECGFEPYENEWWHFSDRDEYPVEENYKF